MELKKENVRIVPASSGLSVEEMLSVLKDEKNIQVFDADSIAGEDHIRLAFLHAGKAFEESRNIVRDRMLEILLRVAASRQVPDAVKRVGIKDPKHIIIAFEGDAKDVKRKESVLERLKAKEVKYKQNKKHLTALFDIDPKKDIERQVIEKMVLQQLE